MPHLCLDLSTTATGWAVANVDGEAPVFHAIGTIKPKASLSLGQKFCFICDELGKVKERHPFEFIAVEELTHFRSADTVRALAGLIGSVELYASACFGIHEVERVRVSTARRLLGVPQGATKAERKADKDIIKKRVREKLLRLGVHTSNFDEADACALAFCFAHGGKASDATSRD